VNSPHDRVTLTSKEQRALASLEARAGRDDPTLEISLGEQRTWAQIRSHRAISFVEILGFVAGMSLTLFTFVQWPAVAVGGVVLQAISLGALLTRWGPTASARIRAWIQNALDPSP
jgi:hypothetical protein